jgi:hypothetical protein
VLETVCQKVFRVLGDGVEEDLQALQQLGILEKNVKHEKRGTVIENVLQEHLLRFLSAQCKQ